MNNNLRYRVAFLGINVLLHIFGACLLLLLAIFWLGSKEEHDLAKTNYTFLGLRMLINFGFSIVWVCVIALANWFFYLLTGFSGRKVYQKILLIHFVIFCMFSVFFILYIHVL
jgi:hypothetical protein